MQLNIVPYTYEDFQNRKIGDVFIRLNEQFTKPQFEKALDDLNFSHFYLYKHNNETIHTVATIRFLNNYADDGTQSRYISPSESLEFTNVENSYQWVALKEQKSFYHEVNENGGQYLWKLVDPTIEEFLGVKLNYPNIEFDHGIHKDSPLLDEALRYRIQVELYHRFIKSVGTPEFTSKSISKVRTKVRGLIKATGKDKIYPDIAMWMDNGKIRIRINYKVKEPKVPKPIKKSYNRFAFLPKK